MTHRAGQVRDVIKGHENVIGNNSRTEGDTVLRIILLRLARQDAYDDMQHGLLYGSLGTAGLLYMCRL